MPIPSDDRIAFSSQIVTATLQIRGILQAQAQLGAQITKLQALDTANKNLMTPSNALINGYHSEFGFIDGNGRTSITEQDILDSANKKFQNHFFPNDINTVVPSLVSLGNVWPRLNPFALTFAIGKNYVEGYTPIVNNETSLIATATALITSIGSQTDIQNTTGQQCVPTNNIQTFATVQTNKTNLVNAINSLKTALLSEVAAVTTNDPDVTRQTQNNAAITNINTVIIPALNTWLAYPDFNTAHGQTTCVGFNAFNSNLLAPTKLHSTQRAALQTALNARTAFLVTRTSQLNANLGSITQNITTGEITASSGFYGTRYAFLALRLNALGGSLTQLASAQASSNAQTSIANNIQSTANTYNSILPTSALKSAGNGTETVHLVTTGPFSIGDTVYIVSDNQPELQRAVKSIAGDIVVLNDIVPAKYTTNPRIYKDLT